MSAHHHLVRRGVLALVVAVASSGCFTTWAGIRAAGYPGAGLEGGREERVPLPGVTEKLVVSLPPEQINPSGVHFECKADQHARDAIYRSGFRYGRKWRTTYAVMFALEAALGGALVLATPTDDPNRLTKLASGWFFAADAVGTGALAVFAPRKEIFEREDVPVTTPVRSVCPDGVMVEIGAETFPLDAAGQLGELGTAALDEWFQHPNGSLVITFAGRSSVIDVGPMDQCNYSVARGTKTPASDAAPASSVPVAAYAPNSVPGAPQVAPPAIQPAQIRTGCGGMSRILAAVIEIPAGTLAMQ
jgi:hypothetical protein